MSGIGRASVVFLPGVRRSADAVGVGSVEIYLLLAGTDAGVAAGSADVGRAFLSWRAPVAAQDGGQGLPGLRREQPREVPGAESCLHGDPRVPPRVGADLPGARDDGVEVPVLAHQPFGSRVKVAVRVGEVADLHASAAFERGPRRGEVVP